LIDVTEAWGSEPPSGGLLARPFLRIQHSLLSSGLEWADRAIVPSSVTASSLSKNYGFHAVDIVPAGTPVSTFRESNLASHRDSCYTFVTLGRLVPEKRQSDFVRALALLKQRKWTGRAAIVGSGPGERSLRKQARALGVQKDIDFTGRLPSAAKFSVLRRSKVFVLCSEREGQSIATLEALSCGLPAIVAKPRYPELFGVSDMVKDGFNGLYYPVGDVELLARSMQLLDSETEKRDSFARNAVTVAAGYDSEIAYRAFENCIRAAASKK
jgi:glycosyltransferase involved in cell wall biosynthesis